MDPSIHSNTGTAPVKKQGHTSIGQFGDDPKAAVRGRPTEPTSLTLKSN